MWPILYGEKWGAWLEKHILLDITRILALQTGKHHRKCLSNRGYSDCDFRKTYHWGEEVFGWVGEGSDENQSGSYCDETIGARTEIVAEDMGKKIRMLMNYIIHSLDVY